MPPSGPPSFSPLFGDHAVLQRDKPVPIWGTAAPGEPISVRFQGQCKTTITGPDGSWRVCLEPLAASASPADLEVAGQERRVVRDVVVGDVWLASGQSNMEFTVKGVVNAAREMAEADFPLIRHFKVERTVSTEAGRGITSKGWERSAPATVGEFTAVGFFFAREVFGKVGVPVGIVHSSWGGTPVESWMSDSAREATSLAAVLRDRWRKSMADWPPERVSRYPSDMEAWQKAEDQARAEKTANLLEWPQPPATDDSPALPGGLFNGMIAPLQPCALRGVLWYQGEANAERSGEYAELFLAMIRSWRAGWNDDRFPFYFVQLANYRQTQDASGRDWARLREAQAAALALPATGMAVAVDVGQADDIHPVNKQDVGRRLARIALAGTHGLAVESRGPRFVAADREGAALRVRFAHASPRLVARGDRVQSLELAGPDRIFFPAEGTIERDTLRVLSKAVADPVAVRYAWVNDPDANLYNEAGLPAEPFRSDDW